LLLSPGVPPPVEQSVALGRQPSDPATFALAAVTLAAATMAACYVPARRAARVDPARTLAEQ